MPGQNRLDWEQCLKFYEELGIHYPKNGVAEPMKGLILSLRDDEALADSRLWIRLDWLHIGLDEKSPPQFPNSVAIIYSQEAGKFLVNLGGYFESVLVSQHDVRSTIKDYLQKLRQYLKQYETHDDDYSFEWSLIKYPSIENIRLKYDTLPPDWIISSIIFDVSGLQKPILKLRRHIALMSHAEDELRRLVEEAAEAQEMMFQILLAGEETLTQHRSRNLND